MPALYRTTTPASQAIWLGGSQQPYRAGIVLSLPVPLAVGDVLQYVAECEGSVYVYPNGLQTGTKHQFVMFQTSSVVVFGPGVTPPDLYPLAQWPPSGCEVTSLPMGQDIGVTIPNYYYPVSRYGVFKATLGGTHTVVMYMWGGSSDPAVGTGNAALVYPNTSSLAVLVTP